MTVTETFDPYAPSSDARYQAMRDTRARGGVVETPAGWYVATGFTPEPNPVFWALGHRSLPVVVTRSRRDRARDV